MIRVKPTYFPFVAFSMLTVFGLFPAMMTGRGLEDLHRRKESLVEHGSPIVACVTEKRGGESPYVTYEYQVAGRRYEWSAEPTQQVWIGLTVGGPLSVLYLPSDPSVSEYQPAAWLKGQEDVKYIGRIITAVGIGGLVISGLAVAARSKGLLRDTSVLSKVFSVPRVIGSLFFAAGMGFQGMILWESSQSTGFVLTVNGGPPHVASLSEIVWFSLFLVPFWVIGLALMSGKIRSNRPS